MNKEPVKVHFKGESMWAEPVKFQGPVMYASLANDPVLVPFNFGDVLRFKKDPEYNAWFCIEDYQPRELSSDEFRAFVKD